MCSDSQFCSDRALSFESMLTDPLIRLVKDSDGVTVSDMVDVLTTAREALVQREIRAYAALIA